MKTMKTMKTIKTALEVIREAHKVSEAAYSQLSELLNERSHSFGILPIFKFAGDVSDRLDELFQTEDFYYHICKAGGIERTDDEFAKYISQAYKVDREKVFLILKEESSALKTLSKQYGEILSNLISGEMEVSGFKPIDDLIAFIDEKTDCLSHQDPE